MNDTSTHPKRWRLALLALLASFALIASACGDDDDSDAAPAADAAEEDTTDDDMAEDEMDEMADDDMAEEDMDEMAEEAHEELEDIRAELAAAGLDDGQIVCVLDAAVAEWGAEALTAPGQASDEQLLRLGEITFACL